MTPSNIAEAIPPISYIERATPRRTSPHTRGSAEQLKQLLVGAIVGGGGALVSLAFLRSHREAARATFAPGHSSAVTVIGMLVAAFLLAVLIHEMGHALLARTAGMRMIALWCGPVVITTFRGVRMGLNRSLALAGAAVICAPEEWSGRADLVPRMRRLVAGGPLASFIAAAIAVGFLVGAGGTPSSEAVLQWSRHFVALFALMSTAIGLVTSLPIKTNGMAASDGAKLRWLRRAALSAGEPALPYTALWLLAQRDRPRNWNADLVAAVERTLATLPPSARCTALLLQHQRSVDVDDNTAAAHSLAESLRDGAVASGSAAVWQVLAMEAALFELVVRRDLEAGERWLSVAMPMKHDPIGRSVADAARALLNEDGATAEHHLQQALAAAERPSLPCLVLSRQRYLELIADGLRGV
jgi:hypothetical protein